MIDRERVQQLIKLLKSSTSVELAVREGDMYIRVRKAVSPAVQAAIAAVGDGSRPGGHAADSVDGPAPDDVIVTAKLVGRFYHGKGPGQPPIVKIGDTVSEGAVVATIDALGKITGVSAVEGGDVIEFLAEDGQPVDYGAPLIRLKRDRE